MSDQFVPITSAMYCELTAIINGIVYSGPTALVRTTIGKIQVNGKVIWEIGTEPVTDLICKNTSYALVEEMMNLQKEGTKVTMTFVYTNDEGATTVTDTQFISIRFAPVEENHD